MAAAGDYPTLFTWLRHSQGDPDEFGQKPDEYAQVGSLWGVLETVDANRETALESERQQYAAQIRVRNYPAIVPGDLLREVGSGDEWTVLTVTAGDNEMAIEVEG